MNIISEIKNMSFKRYNLLLYTKDNAIKAIDILQKNKIPIFGFDSFLINGVSIQPFMEYSSNYSNIKSRIDIYNIAKQDIDKAYNSNPNFVFELDYEGY